MSRRLAMQLTWGSLALVTVAFVAVYLRWLHINIWFCGLGLAIAINIIAFLAED